MNKQEITKALDFAERMARRNYSQAYLIGILYATYGGRIGIGYCGMIAEGVTKA